MDRSLFHVGARPEQLPQSPMLLLEYIIYLYNTIRQETLRLTSTCIRRGNTHLCSSAVKMIHVWHLKSSIYLCNLLCELHCLNCLNDFSWTQAPIKKCQARTSAENVTITQGPFFHVARTGCRSQSLASRPAESEDRITGHLQQAPIKSRGERGRGREEYKRCCLPCAAWQHKHIMETLADNGLSARMICYVDRDFYNLSKH